MKIASARGAAHQLGVDLIGREQVVAARASSSSPIDTQQSEMTAAAPATAAHGILAQDRPSRRRRAPRSMRGGGGCNSLGQAMSSMEVEALRGVDPRRQHVVVVAAPGDLAAADRAAMLLEGEDVGHHLAGMRLLGQAVDDRHGRVARQLRPGRRGSRMRIMIAST